MKDHITTIVSRYKGRVKGWDVVNEAILEDGSYRKSKFYEILGEDLFLLLFSMLTRLTLKPNYIIMTIICMKLGSVQLL